MEKESQRYLNLTGAPYSLNHPQKSMTLTNYFTAAAASAVIFGSSFINPSIEKNPLIYMGEGLLGSAIGLAMVTSRRKNEAKKISSHSNVLVIDTAPDPSTPPTSADILTRVTDLKTQYQNGSVIRFSSIKGAAFNMAMGLTWTADLIQRDNPHFYSLAIPFVAISAVDAFARYRQLSKIANLEWVITDESTAIRDAQRSYVPNPSARHSMGPT